MNETTIFLIVTILSNALTWLARENKFFAKFPRLTLIGICFIFAIIFKTYEIFTPIEFQLKFIDFWSGVSITSSGLYSLIQKPFAKFLTTPKK